VEYAPETNESNIPYQDLRQRPTPGLSAQGFCGVQLENSQHRPVDTRSSRELWTQQVHTPAVDTRRLDTNAVARSVFEDRRVITPYLMLLLTDDITAQRVAVAITAYRQHLYTDGMQATSRGPPFAHPTFVRGAGASGGGAAGGHTGTINYLRHICASDGATAGLLVVIKELTDLYLQHRSRRHDAAAAWRFRRFAGEITRQLEELDAAGGNTFMSMVKNGNPRLLQYLLSVDSAPADVSVPKRWSRYAGISPVSDVDGDDEPPTKNVETANDRIPSAVSILLYYKVMDALNGGKYYSTQELDLRLRIIVARSLCNWLRPLPNGSTVIHVAASNCDIASLDYILHSLRLSLVCV